MKNASILLTGLAGVLLAACAGVAEDNATPQGLGKTLFEALQCDNAAVFNKYIYTDADRDGQLKAAKNDERLTEEMKNSLQGELLNLEVERPKIEASFAEMRQQALQCGIQDWSKAEFVTCTFDEREFYGLKRASLTVPFRWNGLEYELHVPACRQTERGWVMIREPELRCKQ